jgi:hypothetical protein
MLLNFGSVSSRVFNAIFYLTNMNGLAYPVKALVTYLKIFIKFATRIGNMKLFTVVIHIEVL